MGTLEFFANHLALAMKPLKQAVSSPARFRQFIYRLGWKPTDIPASYQQLGQQVDDVVVALEALIASPDIDKALAVFEKVKTLYQTIQTISETPPGIPDPVAFLEEIKERIFELLFTDYLAAESPTLFNFLKIIGGIQSVHSAAAAGRPSYIRWQINPDAIAKAFTDPQQLPATIFGWGTGSFNFDLFCSCFLELFYVIGVPASLTTPRDDLNMGYLGVDRDDNNIVLIKKRINIPFAYFNINGDDSEIGLDILDLPANGSLLPGLLIQPNIPSQIGDSLRVRDDVTLRVKSASNIDNTFGILIRPGSLDVKYPLGGAPLPDVGFGIGVDYAPANSTMLFGDQGSTRIEINGVSFDFDFLFTAGQPELSFGIDCKGLTLILQSSESDGFMHTLLGDGEKKIDIPLGIEWSSVNGIRFKGGGSFEISASVHISIGPIFIDGIEIKLSGISGPPSGFELDIGANIGANLGPIQFVIENTGLSIKTLFTDGNAGPLDFSIGFKPPDGAGIVVDTGIVKGGGFLYLNSDKGEYVGAVELEVSDLCSLKAVGIIQTKMPDGSPGFSMVVIITAEFTPIQLGFGFTLNGVGGLLGLNRTVKIDALRQGIKTNALQSILFPEDVITNINKIISDIEQVFPPYPGHFLVGPMGIIGWGEPSIITLEVGIILEIPNPRIVIPGIIRAFLPTADNALLKIQVNFLGVIDFDKKYISLDASLYESSLFIYTLSGDMAFRLSWGDKPFFLLSVGGFHPAFKDAPPDLANMTRLTISLLSGSNPRVTIQCYFAVTSNTVQFGAKAELYAESGGFNVYGFIGYDCLFQFDPFLFVADFQAGLALRRGSSTIMGINLSGELSGPSPWDVKGDASISILFFSISVSFHETWGDPPPVQAPDQIDISALLTTAIDDDSNWKADMPDANTQHVSIKKINIAATVIHPFGVLTFSERIVPLGIDITKYGNQLPKDVNHFEIKDNDASVDTTPVLGEFAAANFFDLSDSEKLSRPSYELMTSGFSITGLNNLQTPDVQNKNVNYKFSYLRKKKSSVIPAGNYGYLKSTFKANWQGAAIARSVLSYTVNRISSNAPEQLVVLPAQYAVASKIDMKVVGGTVMVSSYTEAAAVINGLIAQQPTLAGSLQVVSGFELNMN